MNIPPPILENFYNQGGDDDGDDHEHEDEQRAHILVGAWQLILMDHLFSCVYSPLMMLLLRKQV